MRAYARQEFPSCLAYRKLSNGRECPLASQKQNADSNGDKVTLLNFRRFFMLNVTITFGVHPKSETGKIVTLSVPRATER